MEAGVKAQTYTTPAGFKQALEQRLRNDLPPTHDLRYARQLVVFSRFLARLLLAFGESARLKGGLALGLRLKRARTTKDIDVALPGSPAGLDRRLEAAGQLDLGDFMRFEVRRDPEHPGIRAKGLQYDGYRFRVECQLGNKIYGDPFGVDAVFGDPVVGDPEVLTVENVLGFAGIEPPTIRLESVQSHIAQKLHAHTLPRTRPNSRIKDLPDLALLATTGPIDGRRLRGALDRTFAFRATHPLPASFPQPAESWAGPYLRMARLDGMPWPTLAEVTAAVRAFLDPVLAGGIGIWNPKRWRWKP